MSYQCYFDVVNERWAGESVPAECDYVGCYEDIDRGPSFLCSAPDCGCRLFYCFNHLGFRHDSFSSEAKPDSVDWLEHILTDEYWEDFREDHPDRVERYRELVDEY